MGFVMRLHRGWIVLLLVVVGGTPVIADENDKSKSVLLRTWIDLPGLYYRTWAEKSNREYPVDVQIISKEGLKAKIYGPDFGGGKGWDITLVGGKKLKLEFPTGVMSGEMSDASTISIPDKGILKRWLVPTTWYGRQGEFVSISAGRFPYLDVVESNAMRWKLAPVHGTNQFNVQGTDAPDGLGGNMWTRSINFSNGGDQWTPYLPK